MSDRTYESVGGGYDKTRAERNRYREALERIVETLEHSEYVDTARETREDKAKTIGRQALADQEHGAMSEPWENLRGPVVRRLIRERNEWRTACLINTRAARRYREALEQAQQHLRDDRNSSVMFAANVIDDALGALPHPPFPLDPGLYQLGGRADQEQEWTPSDGWPLPPADQEQERCPTCGSTHPQHQPLHGDCPDPFHAAHRGVANP